MIIITVRRHRRLLSSSLPPSSSSFSKKTTVFNGSLCLNNAELQAFAAKFGSASHCSLAHLSEFVVFFYHHHTHTNNHPLLPGPRRIRNGILRSFVTSSLSTSCTSRRDSPLRSCHENEIGRRPLIGEHKDLLLQRDESNTEPKPPITR